jgi:hypothetical protein
MLFLVVSTPERPSEFAGTRQLFWPWIEKYQAGGACRQVSARAGRGAVAVLDVDGNEALLKILNEWAGIVPAHFDTSPLVRCSASARVAGVANGKC